jgi:HK97 gp10 family phage protein
MPNDGISIEIKGLEEIKATFQSLAAKDANKCILTALKAGAVVEQAAITERAPVKDTSGGLLPDGALKSDVTVTTHRYKDGTPYVTVQPGKYTARVAQWVEYGHRLIRGGYSKVLKNGKTKGPGKVIGDVPAHPFIRPAYEASREAVADTIGKTLLAEIEKSAAKKGVK